MLASEEPREGKAPTSSSVVVGGVSDGYVHRNLGGGLLLCCPLFDENWRQVFGDTL
jgi:hypothetical protein